MSFSGNTVRADCSRTHTLRAEPKELILCREAGIPDHKDSIQITISVSVETEPRDETPDWMNDYPCHHSEESLTLMRDMSSYLGFDANNHPVFKTLIANMTRDHGITQLEEPMYESATDETLDEISLGDETLCEDAEMTLPAAQETATLLARQETIALPVLMEKVSVQSPKDLLSYGTLRSPSKRSGRTTPKYEILDACLDPSKHKKEEQRSKKKKVNFFALATQCEPFDAQWDNYTEWKAARRKTDSYKGKHEGGLSRQELNSKAPQLIDIGSVVFVPPGGGKTAFTFACAGIGVRILDTGDIGNWHLPIRYGRFDASDQLIVTNSLQYAVNAKRALYILPCRSVYLHRQKVKGRKLPDYVKLKEFIQDQCRRVKNHDFLLSDEYLGSLPLQIQFIQPPRFNAERSAEYLSRSEYLFD